MEKTLISYCDSTINPTKYCVGCELWNDEIHSCYAGRMTERWQGRGAFDQPVQLAPGRIAQAKKWSDLRGVERASKPWLNPYPRIIFVGDMSDSLSPSVPFDYLHNEIIQGVTSDLGKRHIWLWLTKQAQRLSQFDQYLMQRGIDWPSNLWPGVSITSQSTLSRARYLLRVRAAVRWLSVEPLLSPLSGVDVLDGIRWVVAGGESGPSARPSNPNYFRSLRDQCVRVRIPFYFKQWGEHNQDQQRVGRSNTGEMLDGREWREMPEYVCQSLSH